MTQKVIGYFINSSIYTRKYNPASIPVKHLTHLNYSYLDLSSTGEISILDPWADNQIWDTGCLGVIEDLKKEYRHLKTGFSFGSSFHNEILTKILNNSKSRTNFIKNCLTISTKYAMGDFININWLNPSNNCYVSLVKELREYLNITNSDIKIFITLPINVNDFDIEEFNKYVDLIQIIDNWGINKVISCHISNLYPNIDKAIQYCISKGVNSNKLVITCPLYGLMYDNVKNENDGLYQVYTGVKEGKYENGIIDYNELIQVQSNYKKYWDNEVKCSWLFNDSTFITYCDTETLKHYAKYIIDHNLGGISFWELSRNDNLIELISNLFKSKDMTPNNINKITSIPIERDQQEDAEDSQEEEIVMIVKIHKHRDGSITFKGKIQ